MPRRSRSFSQTRMARSDGGILYQPRTRALWLLGLSLPKLARPHHRLLVPAHLDSILSFAGHQQPGLALRLRARPPLDHPPRHERRVRDPDGDAEGGIPLFRLAEPRARGGGQPGVGSTYSQMKLSGTQLLKMFHCRKLACHTATFLA